MVLILEMLLNAGVTPTVLLNANRVLLLEVKSINLRFIDSLAYLPR